MSGGKPHMRKWIKYAGAGQPPFKRPTLAMTSSARKRLSFRLPRGRERRNPIWDLGEVLIRGSFSIRATAWAKSEWKECGKSRICLGTGHFKGFAWISPNSISINE